MNDPLADALQKLVRNSDALQSVTDTLSFEGATTKVNTQLFPQIANWLEELRVKSVREVLQILKKRVS